MSGTAKVSELDELTAELWKLDQWLEKTEAQLRVHKMFRRMEEANHLQSLVSQAHIYAGKFRTLRAERLSERQAAS